MTDHSTTAGRNLAIENRAIAALKPNPRNARKHSKRQIKAIAESIKAFGFCNPVLIDDGGMILAGHGRFEASKLMGLDTVPAIRIGELSEAQKRAYVLADNQLADRAGWDRKMLAIELGELSVMLPTLSLSLELTGFELKGINTILTNTQREKAPSSGDELALVAEKAVSRSGDLWLLGQHRLLCADAHDQAAVRQLVGKDRIDMVFTTPPFVAAIEAARGHINRTEFPAASREVVAVESAKSLHLVLQNMADVSRPGALHFVCTDRRHISVLLQAGQTIYAELADLCVWPNSNSGQDSLYRAAHELIAVFKVRDGEHDHDERGLLPRKRCNVWHYAGVKTDGKDRIAAQPATKPVALIADAITDATASGAIVLDPFAGQGATLMAAERAGRHARLLEIDPRFVDLIVRSFEQATKVDAVHAQTGATYAELARARADNA